MRTVGALPMHEADSAAAASVSRTHATAYVVDCESLFADGKAKRRMACSARSEPS